MRYKTFDTVAGTVFLVVAVLHLLRAILGWEAVIADWYVPMWLSWAVVILAGYLSYEAFKARRAG